MAAALDLFVSKGFAATRVEEVASLAGVSKGTLFLYFPSKEELFKAVVREHISGRFAQWGEDIQHFDGNSQDMLRHFLMSWWQHIGGTKAAGIPKLMLSESRNFPELAAFYQQEVIQPGCKLVASVLQRGVARGEFRPLDIQNSVYMVLAPLLFLNVWEHSLGARCDATMHIEPEKYLGLQLDMLQRGFSKDPLNTGDNPPMNLEL
jgi:TetR/AcrR family transcriptional regulator